MPAKKSKNQIVIEQAKDLGFCFGVRRAIKIIMKAGAEHPPVVTLGPIVHNKGVVQKLSELGIEVVKDFRESRGNSVAISSHGAAPELLEEIKTNKIALIDTTCPNVRNAQKAAQKLAENGFRVVIFGDSSHPEVKGLLGWAGDNAIAALTPEAVSNLNGSQRLGILSQTTQAEAQFTDFVKRILDLTFEKVKEVRILNTLCRETVKRQEAALNLARNVDLMVVIGGLNSANTRHLAEICNPLVETYLIEDATSIEPSWLKEKGRIGITAGTSTPDEAIQEVVDRLDSLTEG
jgi:4-hydroxy-3-methylbut-2-en-1-yl diphosphate reductase